MPACHAGDRRFESGRVRQTHLPTPRPPARTGRSLASGRMPAMPRLTPNRIPLLVLGALLVVGIAVPITGGELGFGSSATPLPSPTSVGLGAIGSPTAAPTATTAPSAPASSPPPTATPVPTPSIVQAAIVPVTQFRAPVSATNRAEVEDVLAGRSKRYEALTLVAAEADPILAALRVERPS